MWDTSRILNESSNIGDVFHNLLGYADHPTPLQAMVWVTYLSVSVVAFVKLGRRGRKSIPTARTDVAAEASEVAPVAGEAAGTVASAMLAVPHSTS
jgi:high-affinity Fe2+/Pb2+ permease